MPISDDSITPMISNVNSFILVGIKKFFKHTQTVQTILKSEKYLIYSRFSSNKIVHYTQSL